MKIKITKDIPYLQKTRQIEKGHVFNVIVRGVKEKFVRCENRKRLVDWYYIIPHNRKGIIVYDYECELIETVEHGIVTELKKILKTL